MNDGTNEVDWVSTLSVRKAAQQTQDRRAAVNNRAINLSGVVGWQRVIGFVKRNVSSFDGGGGGIRTPETLSSLTVFKTAALNHSATPPLLILPYLSDDY